jgi:hypothetical protein
MEGHRTGSCKELTVDALDLDLLSCNRVRKDYTRVYFRSIALQA